MEAAPSKFKAVMTSKCPRCREGKVFAKPLFREWDFLRIHENCPSCGVKYEIEPGFFWGAMYINYGFNVATLTALSLAVWLFWNPDSPWPYIISVIAGIVLTVPFTARFSRILMLHWFSPIKYDPEWRHKEAETYI